MHKSRDKYIGYALSIIYRRSALQYSPVPKIAIALSQRNI